MCRRRNCSGGRWRSELRIWLRSVLSSISSVLASGMTKGRTWGSIVDRIVANATKSEERLACPTTLIVKSEQGDVGRIT
ncbi:hypothetical protein BD309DRAFT_971987 [Dichomitus squalens]|nr:hypothetical protein BD309DRAFT_971987 [Dichomitus squalens]